MNDSLLHELARNKDRLDELKKFLDNSRVDVDGTQHDNTTPLHQAVLTGNTAAVELLLKFPVDINNRNQFNNWTILMTAAFNNSPRIIEKLLIHPDININAVDGLKRTALHLAAEKGAMESVAVLLTHPGLRINLKDYVGFTPLSKAAFNGHSEVVKRLLNCPDINVNLVDKYRQTALHQAVVKKHMEVVVLLLHHPDINVYITSHPFHKTAYETALDMGYQAIAHLIETKMTKCNLQDQLSPEDDYEPFQPEDEKILPPFDHVHQITDEPYRNN
jgi:ankyrin repeat protein